MILNDISTKMTDILALAVIAICLGAKPSPAIGQEALGGQQSLKDYYIQEVAKLTSLREDLDALASQRTRLLEQGSDIDARQDSLAAIESEYTLLKNRYDEDVRRLRELNARYQALTAAGAPVLVIAEPPEDLESFKGYYDRELGKLGVIEGQLNALADQQQAAAGANKQDEVVWVGAEYNRLKQRYDEGVRHLSGLKTRFETRVAQAGETEAPAPREATDIDAFKNYYNQELAKLQALESRLNVIIDRRSALLQQDPPAADEIAATEQEFAMLKKLYDEDVRRLRELKARYQAVTTGQAEEVAATNTPSESSQRKPAKSVETLLQEEHAVFTRRLTLEPGITYNRFDRQQVVLSGFLALDAIFLGQIGIEGVGADTLRYDLGARYGVTDRLNLNFNLPYLQRETTFQKGGAGGTSAIVGEAEVSRNPSLGDVSLGFSYQLIPESPARPDLVWNLNVTAPTGDHPYGIKTKTVNTSEQENPLKVPSELPAGSGIWSASTGLSVVKTLDPAILFANLGYTFTFPEEFDDISSEPGQKQAGEVDPGDSFQYGAGMAFALNERMSLSLSYAHSLTSKTETRNKGGNWQDILGSDLNAASMNIGVTLGLGDHLSLATNLGAGLTDDAPDLSVSVKLPYTF